MEINFNLRTTKGDRPTPIRIIIRYNGWRLVYSSKEKVKPEQWSKDDQRVKGRSNVAMDINAALDTSVNTINETYRKLKNDRNQIEPTTAELKKALDLRLERIKNNRDRDEMYLLSWTTKRSKVDPQKTDIEFSGFMNTMIKELDHRRNYKTGRPFSANTIRNYISTQKVLKDFAEAKNNGKGGLLFSEIDLNFYGRFVSYCEKERKMLTNTIGSYVKVLKAVIRDADERGIKIDQSYKSKKFATLATETDAVYLTETELVELANIDLSTNKRLERVRDLFLVGCRTGLRWSDFSSLRQEDFETGSIRKRMQKVNEYVSIPIHPDVERIRQRYDTPNRLPVSVSNQKFNDYIKQVCQLAPSLQKSVSITKGRVTQKVNKYTLISSHTVRRTFATNCYLLGVPTRTIMNITGHKSEKEFFKYIRMTPQDDSNILSMYLQGTNGSMKVV